MVHDNSFSSRALDIFVYIFMFIVLAVTLMPILHVVSMSLSSSGAINRGQVGLWPVEFTTIAYNTVWAAGTVPRSFINSVYYTTLGTLINLIMTVLMAYPLSKADLPFRSFFMKMVIITMFFGGGMIPNFLLVTRLGLFNSVWALVLPGAISSMNMIIMRTFFEGHPRELEESAIIDGANDFRVLFSIILPLSKASLATIGMFYAVSHWNSWFPASIYLRDMARFPLQLILREIVINNQMAMEMAEVGLFIDHRVSAESIQYAVLVISIVPMLLIYPFAQKYFVKGAMLGSIKG
ncbi:MAG: carbohydrate ABC transporter permease [Defluviitaleaceae bacterium]|nr:carbohydrate ABC transporter permease [Defluviitaleaceae bacterium]